MDQTSKKVFGVAVLLILAVCGLGYLGIRAVTQSAIYQEYRESYQLIQENEEALDRMEEQRQMAEQLGYEDLDQYSTDPEVFRQWRERDRRQREAKLREREEYVEKLRAEQPATLELFNDIEEGMTYQQVVDLVGVEGTLFVPPPFAEKAGLVIYNWGNRVVGFSIELGDGKVVSMSQIDLH